MSPIRLLPNGAIETDSVSEFDAVYKIVKAVDKCPLQNHLNEELSDVEVFVNSFPEM